MAFLLSNSVFIHTPKTGGQWVAGVLEQTGLLKGTLGVVHATPQELAHEEEFRKRNVRFAMVRHPLSWYQSIWTHRMDEQWAPVSARDWFSERSLEMWREFTDKCRSETFDEFVRKCTTHYPHGYVSALYDSYTQGCTFVGRQETLAADLLTVLRGAGEQFDTDRIRETPDRNVRSRGEVWLQRCQYTPELLALVMRAEARAIAKFHYLR